MGMIYKTREGPTTTDGLWTALTTQGSNTTPGSLLVPNGKSRIKQILVSIGANTPTAAAGGNIYLVRLSGACKEQVLCVGGIANPLTTDGANHGSDVYTYGVDISVTPGGTMYIEACPASGTVVNTDEFAVTLGFA